MHGSQAGGGEVGGGVLGEAGGEVGGAEAGDADGVWRGATEAEPPGAWRGVLDVDDLHVLDAQQFLHARGLRASRAWMWTRGHHTELTTTMTHYIWRPISQEPGALTKTKEYAHFISLLSLIHI